MHASSHSKTVSPHPLESRVIAVMALLALVLLLAGFFSPEVSAATPAQTFIASTS